MILFDGDTDEVSRIGTREWSILSAADGTRDLDGIVVAARRLGVRTDTEQVQAFLDQMVERGLVVGTPEPESKPAPEAEAPLPDERPVSALPGYRLSCDRSGRCCRMYSTILATEQEAERARALVPTRSFGGRSTAAFCPVRGSVAGAARVLPVRDGACGYLDDDGACAIHKAAGLSAKPAGCQLFPATFIDDGQQIRVSVKTECACVLDSAASSGGDPLVDPAIERADQLPAMVVVGRLADSLPITEAHHESREAVVNWTTQCLAAPQPDDVARACWAMADGLDPARGGGLDRALERWGEAAAEPPPDVDAVMPYVEALAKRAAARTRVDTRWRSTKDRVRAVGSWVSMTMLMLRDAPLLAEVLAAGTDDPQREGFFVQAALFGYTPLDTRIGSLERGLRDLAVKIWIARAMRAMPENDEEPLSALEAWLRAYGAWRYITDV